MGGSTTGGGGAQLNGTVRITNSTFSGNSATAGSGGGFQSNGSNQILTNVTVVGNSSVTNGGGIHRGTTNVNLYIRNSIIAGNNGAAGSPDVTNSAGGITSEGHNIVGVTGTSTGWIGSDLLDTDPLLGPLQDNGGLTLTHFPMLSSPAIDAGDNCVFDLSCTTNNPPEAVTTDQRGAARPVNVTIDIGAVEGISVVNVGGRVLSPSGRGTGRIYLSISDGVGVIGTVQTNPLGYFVFRGIETGQSYTISAASKELVFSPLVLNVNESITDIVINGTVPMLRGTEQLKK
jgi:hypothetical protein